MANYYYFNNAMICPEFEFTTSVTILGKWSHRGQRKISISLPMINEQPWRVVREVLHHEMAHQYITEVLGIRETAPHGELFKKICSKNAFDQRASGIPKKSADSVKAPDERDNRVILEKVQKLLALAAGTNKYEAELAMTKAREFLLRHNLSLLELNTMNDYICREVGGLGKRNPIKSMISSILNRFFFVETLWIYGYDQHNDRSGMILEIYGTVENVDMAEYVHDYLHNISELLWKQYKSAKGMKGNKHRRTYVYGLLTGFMEKLENQNKSNQSKSLVWKGDPALYSFFRKRNPKIRSRGGVYRKSSTEIFESAHSRGKNLIIHKGVGGGPKDKGGLLA